MIKFFEKNIYKIVLTIFVLILPFLSFAQTAPDEIIVETTGYSVLSMNSFVFGGAYSGNVLKKPFTTYFEFEKYESDSNLSLNFSSSDLLKYFNLQEDREETIKIVRPTKLKPNVDEYNDFYTSPELDLFSTYYFRAVGYFNDIPDQKFYGNLLKIDTGYIPAGYLNMGVVIPFTLNAIEFGDTIKFADPVPYVSTIRANVSLQNIDPTSVYVKANLYNAKPVDVELRVEYGEKVEGIETSFHYLSDPLQFDTPDSGIVVLNNLTPNTVYGYRLVEINDHLILTADQVFTTLNVASIFTPIEEAPTEPEKNTGLVPCDGSTGKPCGFEQIGELINTVIDFILFKISLPLAAIMFAYAGFELVTSGGSTEKKSKATSIFTNVAIGLIVVAAAWLIVQAILGIVGYSGPTFFGK